MISESTKEKIKLADKKLNLLHCYEANNISKNINDLINNGNVEVGYKSQCGATHVTQKSYREFYKIINLLKKEGYSISEELVKHNNKYATNNGGFWNSVIFKIIN